MTQISTEIAKLKIDNDLKVAIQAAFEPFELQAEEWKKRAEGFSIESEDEIEKIEQATIIYNHFRKIRLDVDKTHKSLKADYLAVTQTLDLIKRTLTGLVAPLEEEFENWKDFIKIKEQGRYNALLKERADKLRKYVPNAEQMPLADMNEDAFNNLIVGYEHAEAARVEQEIIRQKELEEQKGKERQAAEEVRRENEELVKKLKEESKLFAEQQQREREARLKVEEALRAKEAAEALKKKEEAAAKRKASRAPDHEKVRALLQQIREIKMPSVGEDYEPVVNGIDGMIGKMLTWGEAQILKLK